MNVKKIVKAVMAKLAANFRVQPHGTRAIIKDSMGKDFDAAISFVTSKRHRDCFYLKVKEGFIEIGDAYYLEDSSSYPSLKELSIAAQKHKREMEAMVKDQDSSTYDRYHEHAS